MMVGCGEWYLIKGIPFELRPSIFWTEVSFFEKLVFAPLALTVPASVSNIAQWADLENCLNYN